MSQQHVNRILERDTVEINKLLLVSQALEFNFFQLFHSSKDEKFTGKNTAVAYGGGFNYAHVGDKITNGDAAIAELKMTSLDELLKSEKERSAALKDTLDSKNMIISMLQEKIRMWEEKVESQQLLIDSLQEKLKSYE